MYLRKKRSALFECEFTFDQFILFGFYVTKRLCNKLVRVTHVVCNCATIMVVGWVSHYIQQCFPTKAPFDIVLKSYCVIKKSVGKTSGIEKSYYCFVIFFRKN